MLKYILKRIILLVPTLLVILTLVFALMRMIPGGPALALLEEEIGNPDEITPEMIEQKKEEMGLNDPIIVQWWKYVKGIVTGDWGVSYFNNKPVFKNMTAVWEPTLIIDAYATIITIVIAIPVGILAATHRNSIFDYTATTLATCTMVIPSFCFGLLISYFLGFKLGWFPCVGFQSLSKGDFWKTIWTLTLPSFALGLNHVAGLSRHTRSQMLDVLNQDYIRTARAKGLSRNKVYYKHALKNTLSIVGTMVARSIAGMLGGAAVIESVFNINGMGKLAVSSISRRDYSQEQAIIVFFALVKLGLDLLLDIFYKLLDPRIEYE